MTTSSRSHDLFRHTSSPPMWIYWLGNRLMTSFRTPSKKLKVLSLPAQYTSSCTPQCTGTSVTSPKQSRTKTVCQRSTLKCIYTKDGARQYTPSCTPQCTGTSITSPNQSHTKTLCYRSILECTSTQGAARPLRFAIQKYADTLLPAQSTSSCTAQYTGTFVTSPTHHVCGANRVSCSLILVFAEQ